MQNPQEARPRAKSPFTAAFLSLLFPGLGHLYAGAPIRALGFAAAPILLLALSAGFVLRLDRFELLGAFLQLVGAIFAFNLIALVYRLVAIVDAYASPSTSTPMPHRATDGSDALDSHAIRSRSPVSRRSSW